MNNNSAVAKGNTYTINIYHAYLVRTKSMSRFS